MLLRIHRPSNWTASEHNHVIWCLYIPDENEDETIELEKTSLLVTTHDERVNKMFALFKTVISNKKVKRQRFHIQNTIYFYLYHTFL